MDVFEEFFHGPKNEQKTKRTATQLKQQQQTDNALKVNFKVKHHLQLFQYCMTCVYCRSKRL